MGPVQMADGKYGHLGGVLEPMLRASDMVDLAGW